MGGGTLDDDLKQLSEQINFNDDEEFQRLMQQELELDNEIELLQKDLEKLETNNGSSRDQKNLSKLEERGSELAVSLEQIKKLGEQLKMSRDYEEYGYVTR